MRYKNSTILMLFMVLVLGVLLSGCSSVFSAYISGQIFDAEDYDPSGAQGAIDGAHVYLYGTEEARDEDYNTWFASGDEDGLLPEEQSDPSYFMIEYTDGDGTYTFSGFTWKSLNPEFGKTADREEIFLLIYHEDYGVKKNEDPDHLYILSDTDNTIANLLIEKSANTTRLMGTVFDDAYLELENVTVAVYVAEQWEYTGGLINEATVQWPQEPTASAITGADGEYDLTVSYPQMPSHDQNNGNTLARILFSHTQYVAENHADDDITDSGWDADDDGEDDPYYQVELEDDTPFTADDIILAKENNETDLTIDLSDVSTQTGVEDAAVRVYLAQEWTYTGDIIDTSSIIWPEGVSYSGSTDAEGLFTVTIEFDRLPSVLDNKGSAPIRIVIEKEDTTLEEAYDAADATWEPIPFEDDYTRFYEKIITGDLDVTYEFTSKKTHFEDQQLYGYLFRDSYPSASPVNNNILDRTDEYDEGLNGYRIGLYLTDVQPGADTIDDAYLLDSSRRGTEGNGYYSFDGISWSDDSYTGNRSSQKAYIMIDTDSDDLWDEAIAATIFADMNGGNYEEIEIN